MCVEHVENLMIRMTVSVLDCASQFGNRKKLIGKSYVGKVRGMVW
jgi:hypothetical protein